MFSSDDVIWFLMNDRGFSWFIELRDGYLGIWDYVKLDHYENVHIYVNTPKLNWLVCFKQIFKSYQEYLHLKKNTQGTKILNYVKLLYK